MYILGDVVSNGLHPPRLWNFVPSVRLGPNPFSQGAPGYPVEEHIHHPKGTTPCNYRDNPGLGPVIH